MSKYHSSLVQRHLLSLLLLTACFCPVPTAAAQLSASLRVDATDAQGQPVAAVRVQLKRGAEFVTEQLTDAQGRTQFTKLQPGVYDLSVSKEGFETLQKTQVALAANAPTIIEFTLVPRLKLNESVEVKATDSAQTALEQSGSPATELRRDQAKEAANRPDTVSDTLPLVPGIVRSDQGQLNLYGSGENRSALIVNYANVTDPATGQFGLTVPIDSVQTINVFRTPYLAQYGRFTAGVVSVETRRGGETWNFELNDPFPEFRLLRRHVRGIREASPRVTFNGPLIKNKLYFSQGTEYDLAKRRVLTLPFPINETVSESFNSFTQLDYLASATHSLTATLHVAPRKAKFFNLDFFNRRAVTPNFSARDYTGTVLDRWTLGAQLLESLVSFKRAEQDVWPQGRGEMTLTPTQNFGHYFNEQTRRSQRLEWLEMLSLAPLKNVAGEHNLKFGGGLTHASNSGHFQARPINIHDQANQLLRRITFTNGAPYDRRDVEVVLFGQDHLVVTPKLAIDVGARFERQSITSVSRLMPRVGLAWTPFGTAQTVLRAGYGLFFDRVPLNVFAFGRYPEQVVTTYGPDGQPIDGPHRFLNITDTVVAKHLIFTRRRYEPGNFAPYSTTWTVEAEHPLTKALRLRIGYQSSNSHGLIVLNPQLVEGRHALVLGGDGQARYRQLEVTARAKLKDEQELVFSYVHSRSRGDLNEFTNYLGSFPTPVVRPNFRTNLPADLPHRFLAWGNVKLPWQLRWAPLVEYRNGFPYFVVNAAQHYVGQPNAMHAPNFFSFDARFTRDFEINKPVEQLFRRKLQDKYAVRASLSAFNLTNHFNPLALHNNTADPQFGQFFGQNRRRFRVDFDIIF